MPKRHTYAAYDECASQGDAGEDRCAACDERAHQRDAGKKVEAQEEGDDFEVDLAVGEP